MIYIKTSIEPLDGEEFDIASVSIMRLDETDNFGRHEYAYGGWWKDKEGKQRYFKSFVYCNREENIFTLMREICLDAEEQIAMALYEEENND